MKKSISIVFIFILVILLTSNVFAANEFVNISSENSEVFIDYDFEDTGNENFSSFSSVDKSYFNPRMLSSNTTVSYMYITLIDEFRKPITGIKVSRIEVIQNNIVVARSNNVISQSLIGRYNGKNLEFLNPFSNQNGENKVDVVMYLGRKEVGRLSNVTITVFSKPMIETHSTEILGIYNSKFPIRLGLINIKEDSIVDAYLVDDIGNKITKSHGIPTYWRYHPETYSRNITFKTSFINESYSVLNNKYRLVVIVDGVEVDYFNNKYEVRMSDAVHINTFKIHQLPNLKFEGSGSNLIKNGPYKVVIEQDGIITKVIEDLFATFNENEYEEEIKLPLLEEYFKDYGKRYNLKIFTQDGNYMIHDYDYLVPVDDTSGVGNIADIVDPLEGFVVFKKMTNVEPTKSFTIVFSSALDSTSINNSNVYVINKKTGLIFSVGYSFESDTSLVMTPLQGGFVSGETYILMIDKRVKSSNGKILTQPAALEIIIK